MAKTVEYMTKNGIRERNAKTNGVRGRSDSKSIKARRKCIQDIFNEYEQITKTDLMMRMDDEARSYGFKMPSSPTTVSNDLTALGLKVHRNTIPKEKPDELVVFKELGGKIRNEIRQIRVSCMETERILYMYSSDKKNDFKDFDSFYKPVRTLVNERKKRDGLKSKSLHIFVILNKKGMENYIGEVFTDECGWVLYAATHIKCVEIVSTLGKVHLLMERIYALL